MAVYIYVLFLNHTSFRALFRQTFQAHAITASKAPVALAYQRLLLLHGSTGMLGTRSFCEGNCVSVICNICFRSMDKSFFLPGLS